MDREAKFYFAHEYILFLAEMQDVVNELYANLVYGGFVYEDTRIDLYEFFDKIPDRDGMWGPYDFDPLMVECSSNIGSLTEYLQDRSEDSLIRDGEEPVAYIQLPADLWNALYGETNDEIAEFLVKKWGEFMEIEEKDYDLTTYGRNAVLIYNINSN